MYDRWYIGWLKKQSFVTLKNSVVLSVIIEVPGKSSTEDANGIDVRWLIRRIDAMNLL